MTLSAILANTATALTTTQQSRAYIENAKTRQQHQADEDKKRALDGRKASYEQAVTQHNELLEGTRVLQSNLALSENPHRDGELINNNLRLAQQLREAINAEAVKIKFIDRTWEPQTKLTAPIQGAPKPAAENQRASPPTPMTNWRDQFSEEDNLLAQKLIEYVEGGGKGHPLDPKLGVCSKREIHGCCNFEEVPAHYNIALVNDKLEKVMVCRRWSRIARIVHENFGRNLPNGYGLRLLSTTDAAKANEQLNKQRNHLTRATESEMSFGNPTPPPVKKVKTTLPPEIWKAQKEAQRLKREEDKKLKLLEREEKRKDSNYGSEKPETIAKRQNNKQNKKKKGENKQKGK